MEDHLHLQLFQLLLHEPYKELKQGCNLRKGLFILPVLHEPYKELKRFVAIGLYTNNFNKIA